MKKRNQATKGKSEKEGTKMKLQKCRIEETKMTKNNEAATETCI